MNLLATLFLAALSLFDIATLFIYSPDKGAGLHIAVQEGKGDWKHVGQLCSSDYGPWGSAKKMYNPFVLHMSDGTWRAVWQVDDTSPTFAAAYSADLMTWRPQDYPRMTTRGCLQPFIVEEEGCLKVYYHTKDGQTRVSSASTDFRHFSLDKASTPKARPELYDTVTVEGKRCVGQTFIVSSKERRDIVNYYAGIDADNQQSAERLFNDDKELTPQLTQPVCLSLQVNTAQEKAISDKLIGIFFEDISYAADGGLYAEMVQNRDFEYLPGEGRAEGWGPTFAWHSPAALNIGTDNPLSGNNPHYVIMGRDSLWNEGWDGMAVKAKASYDFSCYVKVVGDNVPDKTDVQLQVALMDGQKVLAKTTVRSQDAALWTRLSATLTAKANASHARLVLLSKGKSQTVAVDMVSLFPKDTYKGHGLRRDLAEAIAALHPRFVRFPGGCMSHGQGIDNIYHWHQTIGPWQDRTPDSNIWHYHQTRGLGFYEYFQWCEDMGAEPLPVLAAGVPCQNSQPDADGMAGQQGGIPMEEMQAYCEELGHLIEWANGDPATNEWARRRAMAGHPEPFHLKYVGIGNEDLISTTFEERYAMLAEYIHQHYPDIQICGTAGPFHYPSSDYTEGWRFGKEMQHCTQLLDEHYYESSGWFLQHQDYYDNYDRRGPKVYLGEWSAKGRGNRSTVESALAEAIYLCNLERNGDVVEMTSYAPLLCHTRHANWNPDMIYFDNEHVTLTPSYETQRLFGTYAGNRYVSTQMKLKSHADARRELRQQIERRVEASVVRSTTDGRLCLKLVNALPVEVSLNVEGLQLPANMEAEGFSGRPTDTATHCGPLTLKTEGGNITLPPYSVLAVRL